MFNKFFVFYRKKNMILFDIKLPLPGCVALVHLQSTSGLPRRTLELRSPSKSSRRRFWGYDISATDISATERHSLERWSSNLGYGLLLPVCVTVSHHM